MGDTANFIITAILLFIFSAMIYLIKPLYKGNYINKEEEKAYKDVSRFMIPLISMACFFMSTYFIAAVIQEGNYEFSGIYYTILLCIIFTILNNTVLSSDKIREYIRGKKFSNLGLIMTMSVGSIVFGFLDNFGLKLGTDALDTSFLNIFLGPFSVDTRFKDHKDNISENITRINTWSNSKWKSVLNQLLRFQKEIKEMGEKNKIEDFSAFIDDLDFFVDPERGGGPLNIPQEILDKGPVFVHAYVKNIKDKYDLIDGSKNMMGNTFSDFIGAVLGAAVINLFMYTTAYDGINTGDDVVDESFWTKNYNAYAPFLEAFSMAIGCSIPIFINIAMVRNDYNKSNFYSWLVIAIVSILVGVIMYLSVKGVRNMTHDEKVNSVKKTINDLKDRLDITDKNENELNDTIDKFVDTLV